MKTSSWIAKYVNMESAKTIWWTNSTTLHDDVMTIAEPYIFYDEKLNNKLGLKWSGRKSI